jgi:hypothetical protein
MRNVLSLFDYTYYRTYNFFRERGDNISEFSATLVLSLMQFLIVIDIIFITKMVHDYRIPNKFVFLPLLVVIGIINWYRYERNLDIEKFAYQWKDEDERKKVRNGWFIGLCLLISFLIPASTWILRTQS